MSETLLSILSNPAVLERTSPATRRVLEERAKPVVGERFLAPELFDLLQQITGTLLPQGAIGTGVDIAGAIDQRLATGESAGWRFADLPPEGEAYTQGLQVFATMLQGTPMKTFGRMLPPAREDYLRCVANGDVDGPARFPLSKWLLLLRTDAVKIWLAHPDTMQKIKYYGFADGATGTTDGPTITEGWTALTPNKALPFEQGLVLPEGARQA